MDFLRRYVDPTMQRAFEVLLAQRQERMPFDERPGPEQDSRFQRPRMIFVEERAPDNALDEWRHTPPYVPTPNQRAFEVPEWRLEIARQDDPLWKQQGFKSEAHKAVYNQLAERDGEPVAPDVVQMQKAQKQPVSGGAIEVVPEADQRIWQTPLLSAFQAQQTPIPQESTEQAPDLKVLAQLSVIKDPHDRAEFLQQHGFDGLTVDKDGREYSIGKDGGAYYLDPDDNRHYALKSFDGVKDGATVAAGVIGGIYGSKRGKAIRTSKFPFKEPMTHAASGAIIGSSLGTGITDAMFSKLQNWGQQELLGHVPRSYNQPIKDGIQSAFIEAVEGTTPTAVKGTIDVAKKIYDDWQMNNKKPEAYVPLYTSVPAGFYNPRFRRK